MARYSQDTALAASDVPFTPAGDIAATDVQAAIAELDGGKLARTADVTAIVVCTETEYAGLSPDATTLYLVVADA